MNRSEAKRLLANLEFLKAFAEGQDVQARCYTTKEWVDMNNPTFMSTDVTYRIKPRPIEGWVNVYEGGLSGLHSTKASADANAKVGRIKCVFMREVEA